MFSQEVLVEHYFVRRIVAEKIKTNIKNEMSISHRSYALNSHVFASIVMAFLLLTLWQSHQRLIFSSGDCVLKSGARGDHAKSQETPGKSGGLVSVCCIIDIPCNGLPVV